MELQRVHANERSISPGCNAECVEDRRRRDPGDWATCAAHTLRTGIEAPTVYWRRC